MLQIPIEMTAENAAALKRFAEKVNYEKVNYDMACSVLYSHRPKSLRADQAAAIISAFATVDRALTDANVTSWPWIETGQP